MNRTVTALRIHNRIPDEIEALQTDVMRFLAIICLVMMVIFSMVHSLPVGNGKNRPAVSQKKLLNGEIAALKATAATPAQAAKTLDRKIQSNKTSIKALKKALASWQQQLDPKPGTLDKQEKPKTETRPKAQEPVRSESAQLASDLSEPDPLMQESENRAPKEPVPGTRPAETGPKQVFSLVFSSNQALEILLKQQNGIRFYLFCGGRCWQLKPQSSGRYRFYPAEPPGSVYDMESWSVPESIKTAGKKVVAAFGQNQAAYGVSLTRAMTGRIGELMSTLQGGSLVIFEDAAIKVKPTD